MKPKILLVAFGMAMHDVQKRLQDYGINHEDVEIIDDINQAKRGVEIIKERVIEVPIYNRPVFKYDTISPKKKRNQNFKPYRNKMTKGRK